MDQLGQIHNTDHIINISASSPESITLPVSTSIIGVPHLTVVTTNNTISNNTSRRRDSSQHSNSSVNSKIKLCLEMMLIAVQVVASSVSLVLSSHNRSAAEFRELIISYMVLCLLALAMIYWNYHILDNTTAQDSNISNTLFIRIILFETFISCLMEDVAQRAIYRNRRNLRFVRDSLLANLLRVILNIFFGLWLMVSGTQISLDYSQSSGYPTLFWLTVLFFIYGCFEYTFAFSISPVLYYWRNQAKQRALSDLINTLPVHRFKLNNDTCGNDGEAASSSEKRGVLTSWTDMEQIISVEDAVCSICLSIYADDDELMELPCSHLHHKDCIVKWLKIKVSCPLCKHALL